MKLEVDGIEVVDKAEFARMMGIGVHPGFFYRQQRDPDFPKPLTRLFNEHPVWPRAVAQAYVENWRDGRYKQPKAG